MHAVVWLAVAISTEVVATTALKLSDGFTRLGWGAVAVAGYGIRGGDAERRASRDRRYPLRHLATLCDAKCHVVWHFDHRDALLSRYFVADGRFATTRGRMTIERGPQSEIRLSDGRNAALCGNDRPLAGLSPPAWRA